MGSSPVAVTSPLDFAPASSKEFFDIQGTYLWYLDIVKVFCFSGKRPGFLEAIEVSLNSCMRFYVVLITNSN